MQSHLQVTTRILDRGGLLPAPKFLLLPVEKLFCRLWVHNIRPDECDLIIKENQAGNYSTATPRPAFGYGLREALALQTLSPVGGHSAPS